MAASLESPRASFVDVVLRDGSTMRLRPPVDGDAADLVGFFDGFSDRSVYLRFHGRPSIDEALVAPVLDPDWAERGALVGAAGGQIVALASFVRLRDMRTAEVAFAVAVAPILERIQVLDLSLGTLTDAGAAALLASPAIRRLKKLDLHHHFMSADVVEQLKGLGIDVNTDDVQEADEWGGQVHRYVAVSE